MRGAKPLSMLGGGDKVKVWQVKALVNSGLYEWMLMYAVKLYVMGTWVNVSCEGLSLGVRSIFSPNTISCRFVCVTWQAKHLYIWLYWIMQTRRKLRRTSLVHEHNDPVNPLFLSGDDIIYLCCFYILISYRKPSQQYIPIWEHPQCAQHECFTHFWAIWLILLVDQYPSKVFFMKSVAFWPKFYSQVDCGDFNLQ